MRGIEAMAVSPTAIIPAWLGKMKSPKVMPIDAYRIPIKNVSHGFCSAVMGLMRASRTIRQSDATEIYKIGGLPVRKEAGATGGAAPLTCCTLVVPMGACLAGKVNFWERSFWSG